LSNYSDGAGRCDQRSVHSKSYGNYDFADSSAECERGRHFHQLEPAVGDSRSVAGPEHHQRRLPWNETVGSAVTLPVTATSTGPLPVTINAAVSGPGFVQSRATFLLALNPGQAAMLGGEFSPAVPGKAMGQIAFSTNSSTGNNTIISLSGVATPVGSFPVGPLINKQRLPNRSAVISSDFLGTTIFNLASNTAGCTSGLMGSFSCPSGNGWYSHSTSAGDWQQRTLNTCWTRDRI
jgi:hypothetical protein